MTELLWEFPTGHCRYTGVQFHPEAVLTEYGHELLENFCKIAEEFQQEKDGELSEEKTA